MADTSIEWTDATWNPVVGCSRVSAGCMNCYAERFAHRGMAEQHRGLTQLSSSGPQWTGEVRFLSEKLGEPLHWRKPRKVFVNSMSDLFHDSLSNEQIAAVFGVMASAPSHTFQVLTKRPRRMLDWFEWVDGRGHDGRSMFPHDSQDWRIGQLLAVTLRQLGRIDGSRPGTRASGWQDFDPRRAPWPLPNVLLGTSVEDAASARARIPFLRRCPAVAHFLSMEPLLEHVELDERCLEWQPIGPDAEGESQLLPPIRWVIVGGETGNGARECDLAWVRSIVRQCRAAGVACFVKQLGAKPVGWAHDGRPPVLGGHIDSWPEDLQVRQFPEVRDAM